MGVGFHWRNTMSAMNGSSTVHSSGGEDAADSDASSLAFGLPSQDAVRSSVEAVAFWSAVALPFLYVPLLATGIPSQAEQTAFVALLVLNVLALVVGHGHKRST